MKTFLFTILLIISGVNLQSQSNNSQLLREYLASKSDFLSYEIIESDDEVYATIMTSDKQEVYVFISNESEELRGYQGFNKLIVKVDHQQQIKKLELIKSGDTASFVRRVKASDFLQQFVKWTKGKEIRSVTGATLTCKSIEATLANMISRIQAIQSDMN
jgi:Na+-translocating ferredoxin:NAD+ oxidoreductase RnfG subunit